MAANSEAPIWERVIRPQRRDLHPEAARSILAFAFSRRDRDRMHALARKAQEGKLRAEEAAELDDYRRVVPGQTALRMKAAS